MTPHEILEYLANELRARLGDPPEKLLESELDREVYHWLRTLDEDDIPALRAMMALMKGNRVSQEAPDGAKEIEHMLADYRSARSIGKILKIVWIAIAGIIGAVIAIVKGLPDFLEILRGWLK